MATVVGPKGQIVIVKEIRDRLGVKPGWVTLQRLVDDHVEVHFVPPEHRESLKGSLAKYINRDTASIDENWSKVKEDAWANAVKEEADRWKPIP